MFKVIIAGGRDFNDYKLLEKKVTYFLGSKKFGETEIVSGTCKGADLLGEKLAKKNNVNIKQFPADWNTHGKKAGFIRNSEMAEYADALVAFWDGKSRGTKHMIDLATKHNLKVRIVKYER